jgi:hypothetical protein
MAPRRVVSAPVRNPEDSSKDAALIETLCVHPDVRIVSFVAAVDALPPSPTVAREQAGTLAPTSRLQRTIAVGAWCLISSWRLKVRITIAYTANRLVSHLQGAWFSRVHQLWRRAATDTPQESMLGDRRARLYLCTANPAADFLED